MIPGNANPLLLATAAAAAPAAAGPIKSLRFNSGDSAYLSRTPSSAGNRRTWTFATWIKLSKVATSDLMVFSCRVSGFGQIQIGSGGTPHIAFNDFGTFDLRTNRLMRDLSGWFHLCCVFDSTNSTSGDRARMYINGERQTSFSTETYPAQNAEASWNRAEQHSIGSLQPSYANYFDGYMADIYFIDGSALDPTSFGAYDDSGVWQAAAYSGTYGTNGFHLLDFANESTVGHDSSGNENDFTANNILENNNEAADFNAALSSTPFSDGSASSISITNTGSISTSSAGSNSFSISNAAEFTGGSNSGLTLGSAVDRTGLYTLDMYFKLDNLDQQMRLLTNESTTTGNALGAKEQGIAVATDGSLNVYDYGDPQLAPAGAISANTWYHYRLIADGTTIKASYLNGTAQTTSGSIQNFAANTALRIGYGSTSVSHSTDGLIGPIRIVPGDLGAPPSGGLSTTSGALSNSAAALNLSAGIDVLFDVPTNGTQSDTGAGGEVSGNYATLNSLDKGASSVLSNGNLEFRGGVSSAHRGVRSTILPTFKVYAEMTVSNAETGFGLANAGADLDTSTLATGKWAIYNNALRSNGSAVASITAIASGDVVQVAYDPDSNKAWIGKNNSWFDSSGGTTGNPGTGANATFTIDDDVFIFVHSFNDYDTTVNFGARSFVYSAPSGYKALCTTNLPTPTIADGSDYFDVLTWTGDGTGSRSFTGLSFQPDFTWAKIRSLAYTHTLYDSVRGAGSGKELQSDSRNAEGGASTDVSGYLSSFNSDGFSSTAGSSDNDYFNKTGNTYVAWNWDAGSSTDTNNTSGSITPAGVRASTTSGFSIVKYVGTGANATCGHGLSAAPDWIIFKDINRDNEPWFVYHSALGSSAYLFLNTTADQTTGQSDFMNSTDPTSTVFSLGSAVGKNNRSGSNFLALCWTAVAGFSAFGSYEGNGQSSDGTFVHTGFKPKWVLIKASSITNQNWYILDAARDPHNLTANKLEPNTNNAENASPNTATTNSLDLLSNGFKLRTSNDGTNQSGATYIYAAFSENAFSLNGGLAR